MDYEKLRTRIKTLLAEKGVKESGMLETLNMTSAGYYKMFKNESINVNTLENIASFLGVPLWHLLADTKGNILTDNEDYKKKYFQAVEFIAQKLGMPNFNFC
jgi:hypothetical protein